VLVVPVEFSDVRAQSKGYTIDKIVTAFTGASGSTDYFSVDEYYQISSYGQLDLDITVLDAWFCPQYSSSYYLNYTMEYYDSTINAGDMLIIDEVLAYLEPIMDLSQFDSDGNGIIDAIVLINTLDIDADVDMQWAYRYWNFYVNESDEFYEYDGVSANDYLWASYAFMYESYGDGGDLDYSDETRINPYTYIHEFAHVLGADDYYDTAGDSSPMDGADVMVSMLGDHNAFSKFNYGWVTESRLVVAEESVTLTLEDFSKNGDTIIIANNWDSALGAYQEYFIVVYYTNNGLNAGELAGYFDRDGVVVYRINSSLYKETYDDVDYYDIYNNNTTPGDGYGTENNLIEYVKSAADTFTYVVGDRLPEVTLSSGDGLVYTFVVDALDADHATITFSKIA
jgi:M6 family metalloprotease-like protein